MADPDRVARRPPGRADRPGDPRRPDGGGAVSRWLTQVVLTFCLRLAGIICIGMGLFAIHPGLFVIAVGGIALFVAGVLWEDEQEKETP